MNEDVPDGTPRTITTGDLFSAHDFDIQLELDAKLPRKSFSSLELLCWQMTLF